MGNANELLNDLDSCLHIGSLENLRCHPIARLQHQVTRMSVSKKHGLFTKEGQ